MGVVCAFSLWAQADEDCLRCGQRLVTLGEEETAVEAKCGPPSEKERQFLRSRGRHGTSHMTLDLWTYDFGRGEFVRKLRFEDGVLRRIDLGDYGQR